MLFSKIMYIYLLEFLIKLLFFPNKLLFLTFFIIIFIFTYVDILPHIIIYYKKILDFKGIFEHYYILFLYNKGAVKFLQNLSQ